jgi:hypothetical protein
MDWQKTYLEFSAQSAQYLADLLAGRITSLDYESDGVELYGDEWTFNDEIKDALEVLIKHMDHLDAMHDEYTSQLLPLRGGYKP